MTTALYQRIPTEDDDINDQIMTTNDSAPYDHSIMAGTAQQANRTGDHEDMDKGARADRNATEAAEDETRMSLMQSLRKYRKAAAWSVLLSTTIVMLAYDTVLLGSFYAYPSFQKKYGAYDPVSKEYQVSASWQSGLSDGSNVGGIIGLLLAGFLSNRFGHKYIMIGSLIATMAFIFILFFAPNLTVLLVGEILIGIPFGAFQALTTAYASEVAPVVLRHYVTSYINLCWVFGHFIGAGVLRGLLSRTDEWGYKIPFAIQWVWPVPLLLGILFAPQSPWYLIRKGQLEEAEKSLRRLTTHPDDAQLTETIDLMIKTNDIEREIQAGTSYLDCFRGIDLRRTEISVMVYVIQYTSGNGLSGYSTYFFEQAGFSATDSFDLTMAQYAIGFFGTIFSWFLMAHFGRRTLYLTGLVLSSILLMIIGFLSLGSSTNNAINWAKGSMLLVFFCVHSCLIGPVLYAIIGEMPSTRLRQKTIVLGATAWSLVGLFNAAITPHMLNPTAWNWGTKAAFFWGGAAILSTGWAYFRLPEAKHRTFAELDILFAERVGARKFRNTKVDIARECIE